jgi:hypothetical protein
MTDPPKGAAGSTAACRHISASSIADMVRHARLPDRMDQRVELLAAIFSATQGDDEGFRVAVTWASTWPDDPGAEMVGLLWRNWKLQPPPQSFDHLADFLRMQGFNWEEYVSEKETEYIHTEIPEITTPTKEASRDTPSLLLRFSLIDELPSLKSDVLEQTQLCSGLALLGQSTVWNADPNTGKTAMGLWSIIRDIDGETIDPARVFYFNLDDSLQGLIEKTELAQRHGFHVISEGYRGFRATDFEQVMQQLIDADQCHGVVIILDVLKKLVDVMDKGRSSSFGKLIRRFVLRGGTCIALAHTNKRRNSDGEPIYAGTSDIIEDFDCAYLVYETNIDPDSQTKTILFKNKKSRGNVRKQASFQYSVREGLSYDELLESIVEVSEADLLVEERQKQLQSDLAHIEAIREAIRSGINTKMALAALLVEKTNCSKRTAIRVIEQYQGTDPETHFWQFEVGPRGAKMYRLLGP